MMFWIALSLVGWSIAFGLLVDRFLWMRLYQPIAQADWFQSCMSGTHRIVFVVSIDYAALRDKILYDAKADHDTTTSIMKSWFSPTLDVDTRYIIKRLVWPDDYSEPGYGAHPIPVNVP